MADRDSWDSFEESPGSGFEGGDDWGSFGTDDWSSPSVPQESDEQSQMPGPVHGGFIQPDEDGWGSTSGLDEPSSLPDENDFASSQPQVTEFQPRQFNLSMKKVAVIFAVVFVVIALIFLGLDKIHFSKKTQPNNPPQQSQTGQPTQQGQQESNQGSNQQEQNQGNMNELVDSVVLVEIPENTKLDYNGDVLSANGKVVSKLKYVQGHQVLYCINIGVVFGSSQETVSYYCNYSSFNAVQEGDIVILTYQQVNDSYISVTSISK